MPSLEGDSLHVRLLHDRFTHKKWTQKVLFDVFKTVTEADEALEHLNFASPYIKSNDKGATKEKVHEKICLTSVMLYQYVNTLAFLYWLKLL